MIGITAYGAYIPRTRLSRQAMLKSTGWLNPALFSNAGGTRSVANWDEDAVTMAVAAANNCIRQLDASRVDSIYFASPSAPFKLRLNSSIVASALGLNEEINAVDISSSRRCGISALVQAYNQVSRADNGALVVASDIPPNRAGTAGELMSGDAAAALLLGSDNVVAEIVGNHCETVDFVDAYQGATDETGHQWEDRWIRDEGHFKLIPRAIGRLLEKTGTVAESIDRFICPVPGHGTTAKLGKMLGIRPDAIADNLFLACGDSRCAQPLLLLCQALEVAEPGQLILVAAFGQGTEAVLLRTTDACKNFKTHSSVADQLAGGAEESNYFKYLVFRDRVDWDKESRGPVDSPTLLSSHYRDRQFLDNLRGLHCAETRQTFFGSEAAYKARQADGEFRWRSFTNSSAKLLSYSANYLGVSLEPAICTGIIEFDEGGRLIVDLTEANPQELGVGAKVEMSYRIHGVDASKGFTRYFWKAKSVHAIEDATGDDQQ